MHYLFLENTQEIVSNIAEKTNPNLQMKSCKEEWEEGKYFLFSAITIVYTNMLSNLRRIFA